MNSEKKPVTGPHLLIQHFTTKDDVQVLDTEKKIPINHIFNISNLVGPGVNSKVQYDLKKRGKSVVNYEDGDMTVFEIKLRSEVKCLGFRRWCR